MVVVRRLTPDEWRLWREVRLAALADAPYAYGSTLAHEQAFDESAWRERLSAAGMTAVALDGREPVGGMAAFTPSGTEVPLLVAAWVRQTHRGRRVGDALVADVLAWAGETGRDRVELRVADGNEPARRLFTRNGFVPTGEREPLESDPSVLTDRFVWTARVDGGPKTWEIRVGLHATEERARELLEAVQRTLCPDPDHRPPCDVPWQTALLETDDYPALREQYDIERVLRHSPEHPSN